MKMRRVLDTFVFGNYKVGGMVCVVCVHVRARMCVCARARVFPALINILNMANGNNNAYVITDNVCRRASNDGISTKLFAA